MRVKLIILFTLFSICFSTENILHLLKEYYSNIFKVELNDIHIDILKMRDISEENLKSLDIRISSNQNIAKVGTQHAWLNLSSDGKIIDKSPISLNISVKKYVWISNKRIMRNQIIEPNMYSKQKIEITKNYSKYYYGELDYTGKMKVSRKMEEGTVLTNQMYDLVPDVKRGDLVSISLKGETFEITLPGKAKQNGLIGEEVFVLVGATGKRLKGTVDSPNHIIIGK